MTTKKQLKKMTSLERKIAFNKRLLYDYTESKVIKVYNRGEVKDNVFTLYRIKDNSIITKFDITTFLPLT